MSRFFGRFFRLIDHSWQMYPLGLLFGLGFDTATEVGLLALAAGRRHPLGPDPRDPVAADPVRGRHEPHGHARRGVHEPGLRLGVLEPDPQGLLQHHRHEPVGRRRARDRHRRAASGALDQARAVRRRVGHAEQPRLRDARLRHRRACSSLMWAASVAIWKLRRIEDRWSAMVAEAPIERSVV